MPGENGAGLLWEQEIVGSNPIIPILSISHNVSCGCLLVLSEIQDHSGEGSVVQLQKVFDLEEQLQRTGERPSVQKRET